MKTFYLIDGHAQIFRAYYAPFAQTLTSPDGEPTKATYIFTQMLLNILKNKRPDYLAVALDFGDESTERKQFYPEYKANRDRAPEDFGPQVERITKILDEMRVPQFVVKGQEADDIIATIARRLADEDIELRVASKDKDLHQILTEKVKLWDPVKDEVIDPVTLEEKHGFTPDMAVDLQTLTGDSTDNVPGIPGVGPKKALGLLKKYGTVEAILEHVDELTPKMRENFIEHRDVLDISRRLVTLNPDVELDFDLEACLTDSIEIQALRPTFQELNFKRLLDLLDEEAAASQEEGDEAVEASQPERGPLEVHHVRTEAAFQDFLAELKKQEIFAFDTETTSLSVVDCVLVGMSFAWQAGEGWYLALRSGMLGGETLDVDSTLEALRGIFEDPDVQKVGQNLKYDINVLRGAGIETRGVAFDTMVASYLSHPERRGHGLDALARDYLGHETIPISELIGKGKKQISMLDADPERLAEYAAEDAEVTWRLYEKLEPDLDSAGVRELFDDVELPLVEVLAQMEWNGVALDVDQLREASARLATRIEELEKSIHEAAGREFKIDSPKQLAEVLFDDIGLRVVKKTKTSRSTDASVLETLSLETEHPLPGLILEYRELTKLRRTYLEPLPGYVSEKTGRLHASFHQTVAATGRLSSSDPNLQNIPIRTDQGREIRRAFVAGAKDRVLITADYSQIELRILAHLSRDEGLVEAFESGQDIHRIVAAQLAGIDPDEVTREQRGRAKAVNFGIIYGQGAFGLARALGISRPEAADFIDRYKERYPGIVTFMDQCIQQAEAEGQVSTILGRHRPIPEIHSRNRNLRAQGERLAINTVVQGSAADLIKLAMLRIHRRIHDDDLDLQMLIQVHDELVFECPEKTVETHLDLVKKEMQEALDLAVPVVVDATWGENWLEGKG